MVKGLGIVGLCLLAGMTHLRSQVWADDFTLWSAAVRVSPEKPRPRINLGKAYEQRGMLSEAATQYQVALGLAFDERRSRYTRQFTKSAAETNLAHLLVKQGNWGAGARMLDQVLEEWPSFPPALYNRAVVFELMGDCERARLLYEEAIRLEPMLPPRICG